MKMDFSFPIKNGLLLENQVSKTPCAVDDNGLN